MKPQDATRVDDRPAQPTPRKPYHKPQLQVYGDLTDITQGIAGTMMNDGAGHPNKHFTS
jgi:hypothetical protein